MKRSGIIAILYLAVCVSVSANEAILNGMIELEKELFTNEDVLNEISDKTGLTFSFSQDLPVSDSVDFNLYTRQSLRSLLFGMFGDQIQWKLINNKVILKLASLEDSNDPMFRGVVIDAVTMLPLIGASIRLKNSKPLIGTTTDANGRFQLTMNNNSASLDTAIISHIGYEPYTVKVSDEYGDNVYRLILRSIALNEVLIEWNDPRDLMIKALKSIRKNYSEKPSQLRAFYRESLKRNNKYMTYAEGLLDIYKCAYKPSLANDQARLLQLRKFSNIESSDTVLFKLQGGVDAILNLDLVRKPLRFLDLAELDNYTYLYDGIDTIENNSAYKIKFEPSLSNEDKDYSGTIYLDTNSMAILRIIFQLTNEVLAESEYSVVMKAKPRNKIIPGSIMYSVDYKQFNGKYFINYISGNMIMKVKQRRKLLASKYEIDFEMFTTDISTTAVSRFNYRDRIVSRQIITDLKIPTKLEEFYKNNNKKSIFPEKDLLKALEKFRVEELTFNK